MLTKSQLSSSDVLILESAFYMVFGFIGAVGNATVITAILATKNLRRQHPLLIALAGGDICSSLGFFSAGLRRLIVVLLHDEEDAIPPLKCMETRLYMTLFILGTQIPGAIDFLISLERLFVTWLMLHVGKQRIPRKAKALIISLAVLVYLLAIGFAVAFGFELAADPTLQPVPAICWSDTSMRSSFSQYNYGFPAACASLACVVYVVVFVLIRRKSSYIKSELPAISARFLREQLEITKLMGTIVALSFFFFILPACGQLYVIDNNDVPGWLKKTPCFGTLFCIHSSINVCVYATRNMELRRAIFSKLCFWKKLYAISSVRSFVAPPGVKQAEEARHQLNQHFQIPSAMLRGFAQSPETKVGEGYHANVHRYDLSLDGAKSVRVALKIPKSGCGRPEQHGPCAECSRNRKKTMLEVRLLCRLREATDVRTCPHLVRFLGWCMLKDSPRMVVSVTLFCPWTLLNFLRDKRSRSAPSSAPSSVQSSNSGHTSPSVPAGYAKAVITSDFEYVKEGPTELHLLPFLTMQFFVRLCREHLPVTSQSN